MTDIDMAYHDRRLAEYGKPDWLVKSYPAGPANNPIEPHDDHEGEEPDLRHNVWVIRTDDPAKVRDTDITIDYRQPIDECRILLTDPARLSDLITAKIFIAEELQNSLNAKAVRKKFYHLVWIIRWRIAISIEKMEDLDPPLFDAFCNILETNGTTSSLIPLERRLDHLKERILDGQLTWSTLPSTRRNRKPIISLNAICEELGLPLGTQLSKLDIWPDLKSLITQTAPKGSLPKSLQNASSSGESNGNQKLSISAVQQIMDVWETLNEHADLRIIEHDPLQFNPFAGTPRGERTKNMSREPANNGKSGNLEGRMGTPSPEQWLRLLDHAAIWMLDYSPSIIKICEKSSAVRAELSAKMNPGPPRESEIRDRIQAVIDEHKPIDLEGFPNLAPRWFDTGSARKRDSSLSLNTALMPLENALGHVISACLILIGGFTARRKAELKSLQEGCIHEDPFNPGNWCLTSYIAKTIRDHTVIPVPTNVRNAVEILEKLSLTAREYEQNQWITRIYSPRLSSDEYAAISDRKKRISTDIETRLKSFAEMTGVNTNEDGKKWSFTPHQLRRAFAVYYYYSNKYSKLDALSRFLRHFDPEMTRRYVTETMPGMLSHLRQISEAEIDNERDLRNEAKQAFSAVKEIGKCHEDVRNDYQVSRLMDMYDKKEHPIGQGAATLNDLLREMTEVARCHVTLRGPTNISPDHERAALVKQLREIAPKKYMEPISGRHAHCLCHPSDPDDVNDARCLQEKAQHTGQSQSGQPDYAYATIDVCSTCRHNVMFSENIEFVNGRINQALETERKPPNEDVGIAAKQRVEALKQAMKHNREAAERRKSS